tara:strand:- start:558 stop:1085 length:528 start_codon:yes stop_codon:yes gene_type:complete
MIYEFPNYVDLGLIEEIKNESKKHIQLDKVGSYNREGNTVDITNTPELKEIDIKIHSLMEKIQEELVQRRFKPQFNSADSGYEYHRYNAGEQCLHHADGEVINGLLRYASVIIHLSTNDGETIFPQQNKKIKTEEGKVVVFPPYGGFGHYVSPSTTAREVLVSWFVYAGVSINNG